MTPPNDRIARGAAGEAAAAAYLAEAGYRIVDRNWRCRYGELDIVAEKDGALVFVEVRSRSKASLGAFGAPLESITPKKQMTLRRCAEAYLRQRPAEPYLRQRPAEPEHVRFDCIGVILNERNEAVDRLHIPNAF
ncbi:YraN family protein [Paenibacillus sp. TRM 82003]|nr:YraN family protein [Paenibacillus sp. TRM 82003]